MSSRGSSSVRAVSGAVFGLMSGDPLYKDISMPSASHTESVPEVTSCPSARGIVGPVKEVVSTSGHQVDDEAEEVVVSCGNLESSITLEECARIARMYGLQVIEPTDFERPHVPPIGYVILSELYLQFGVRFPLNPFFVAVLQYFSLTVFQITPNGWAHMIGLFSLFVEQGLGLPTAEEFA